MQLFKNNSWEQGAQRALATIAGFEGWEPTVENCEYLHETERYVTLGATALRAMAESAGGPVNLDGFVVFLAKKQAAYGPQNILKYGPKGVEIRLWDKIARLGNLTKRAKNPEWETVYDTWSDILGYCVIDRMLSSGTFMNELEADIVD